MFTNGEGIRVVYLANQEDIMDDGGRIGKEVLVNCPCNALHFFIATQPCKQESYDFHQGAVAWAGKDSKRIHSQTLLEYTIQKNILDTAIMTGVRENSAHLTTRQHVKRYIEEMRGHATVHLHNAGSHQVLERERALIGKHRPTTMRSPEMIVDVLDDGWTPQGFDIPKAVEVICKGVGVDYVLKECSGILHVKDSVECPRLSLNVTGRAMIYLRDNARTLNYLTAGKIRFLGVDVMGDH